MFWMWPFYAEPIRRVWLGYAKHVFRIYKYNLSALLFGGVINIPFFPVWMRSNDREIAVAAHSLSLARTPQIKWQQSANKPGPYQLHLTFIWSESIEFNVFSLIQGLKSSENVILLKCGTAPVNRKRASTTSSCFI